MSISRRLKQLNNKININSNKKPVLFFKKFNDLYYIKLDGKEFELSENELEEFKNKYGTERVVSIINNVPKGNDYIPLDK